MELVILGAGKVGETLIENLIKEKHDLVIIDKDAKKVETIVNKYDVKGIVGNGVSREILSEARVPTADFFLACTAHDEVNVICSILAKSLGAKYTVARVRDPEYNKELFSVKELISLDALFNPEYRTAKEISKVLKFPSATNVESFADGKVSLAEFVVEGDNPMVDKTIMQIVKEYDSRVIFAMVKRDEEIFIPLGDFVIKEGDRVSVLSKESEITIFCKKLHMFKKPVKSVFIIGGGKIGYYLAQELLSYGIEVKIVENREERCVELVNAIPNAEVLLGDGSDQSLLQELKLENSDACITLTGVDEENAMVSLYAKQLGVEKVITKLDRKSVIDMAEIIGLDSIVTPYTVIANYIFKYVRSMQASSGDGVRRLYKFGDNVEALEFVVSENFPHGEKLRDLKLYKDIIIGAIVRGTEYVLPKGDTALEIGDRVIVIVANRKITELNQILR